MRTMTTQLGMALESSGSEMMFGSLLFTVIAAVIVLTIVCMWTVFTKAGKPGWACLIPIYNGWVLCEIAGKPGWWVLLMVIPFVNIVISIIVHIGIAERF